MRRLSKRLSRKSSSRQRKDPPPGPADNGGSFLYSFVENEEAWVTTKDDTMFQKCVVLGQGGLFVTIRIEGKGVEQIDLRKQSVFPRNSDKAEADMTSLRHLNEACILENLEKRSYANEPYTFMGNVLVSVNPLKEIAPPKGALGTRSATLQPHPFAIAEYSFQQMSFAGDKYRKKESGTIINQSIVASGESGAGKTEASKRVLQHLVQRCSSGTRSEKLQTIDRRLLKSNEITESFGNAKTLRNNNSSRFGKLMSLHFLQLDTEFGAPTAYKICAASVQTYLLERSRVSLHETGERNYHVFYQLLSGADSKMKRELGLDKVAKIGWRYLAPLRSPTDQSVSARQTAEEIIPSDKAQFDALVDAMIEMGMSSEETADIFRIVAGIMHLGNASFEDDESPEGDIARLVEVEEGYDPLKWAAALLGVTLEGLEDLLLHRKIKTREGEIIVHRNAAAGSFARDAVAKGLYSHLFDHVIRRINGSLDETNSSENVGELPFIGVLDIFGFESFQRNGFEQLLINFTNESLQSTFNRKVFEAELTLYEREGLVLDRSQLKVPPGNESAMTLLAGKLRNPGSSDLSREEKDAVLVEVDHQCRELQPSDLKMLKSLHAKFGKHPNFILPHPKNAHEQFIVKHYAGTVTYTVGSFIEKNNDSLPDEVNSLFSGSSSPVIGPVFKRLHSEGSAARGKPVHRSIVKQFRTQILSLLETLESTACSFIRCVKPNETMSRGGKWFSRSYVAHQLKHLSIPQTAVVLRSGFPTRIGYESLVETYMKVLPANVTKRAKKAKGDDAQTISRKNKGFVQALFYAFKVERNAYKLGHSKVFFKAGEIAVLDQILQKAAAWESSKKDQTEIIKRFNFYYVRLTARRVIIKMYCAAKFLTILKNLQQVKARKAAALKLQRFTRMVLAKRVVQTRREVKAKAAEREKAIKKTEEKEAAALTRVLTQRQASFRSKTKIFLHQPGSDGESEDSDSDESDDESEDDSNLTEEERREKNAKEVEKRAQSATLKEIKKLEDEGEFVPDEKREEILEKYTDKFAREMARWEAMRVHEQALRTKVTEYGQYLYGSVTNFADSVKQAFTFNGLSQLASTASGTVVEKVRAFDLRNMLENTMQQASEMMRSPVFQRGMDEVADKIEEVEDDRTDSNVLQRQATMTGTTLKVNTAEITTPVNSAKEQMRNLSNLAEKGEISPDEMLSMAKGVVKALERRSSRTHSAESDAGQGITVWCGNCQAERNTMDGAWCKKCREPLPILVTEQMNAFPPPSKTMDTWSGPPLSFLGGAFFVKMETTTTSSFNSVTFMEEMHFHFQCAWELDISRDAIQDKKIRKTVPRKKPLYTRWMIQLTGPQLRELHEILVKQRKNVYKKVDPPLFPNEQREVEKKDKGKMGKIKRIFRGSRKGSMFGGRSNSVTAGQMNLAKATGAISRGASLGKAVDELQKWFEAVIEAANESSPGSGKDHPIFKFGFNEAFDVERNVQLVKVAFKTK